MILRTAILALGLLVTPLAQADKSSLYEELGEYEGISQLMESFILEIAEDDRIIHHFENVDIDRFHKMLTEHICELSAGPCEYTGKPMPEVHLGMNISRAEFNALVEDLMAAMESEQIPVSAQNKLLAILAALHKEVVHL